MNDPSSGVAMNTILEEILTTGVAKTASGETVSIHSHISREEGLFLQEIVKEIRASVSLEVGLAYGVSALFIC
jgi:predicted O-methyltransferase YrrM